MRASSSFRHEATTLSCQALAASSIGRVSAAPKVPDQSPVWGSRER